MFEFEGWNSKVTSLAQAPAIDVVAVGLDNGSIVLHNLKVNKTILRFHQDFGPVTGVSFKTDGDPTMVSCWFNCSD